MELTPLLKKIIDEHTAEDKPKKTTKPKRTYIKEVEEVNDPPIPTKKGGVLDKIPVWSIYLVIYIAVLLAILLAYTMGTLRAN